MLFVWFSQNNTKLLPSLFIKSFSSTLRLWDGERGSIASQRQPLKQCVTSDYCGKQLYMLGIWTRDSHKHSVSKLIPENSFSAGYNSEGIGNLHYCVKGVTEARQLMVLVTKSQGTYTFKDDDLAVCILGAVLHPRKFFSLGGQEVRTLERHL